jgi:hypothetical protein
VNGSRFLGVVTTRSIAGDPALREARYFWCPGITGVVYDDHLLVGMATVDSSHRLLENPAP